MTMASHARFGFSAFGRRHAEIAATSEAKTRGAGAEEQRSLCFFDPGRKRRGGERCYLPYPNHSQIGDGTVHEQRKRRESNAEPPFADRDRESGTQKQQRREKSDFGEPPWLDTDADERHLHAGTVARARQRDAYRRSSVSRTCRLCARSRAFR
jgi:hypothetical protein